MRPNIDSLIMAHTHRRCHFTGRVVVDPVPRLYILIILEPLRLLVKSGIASRVLRFLIPIYKG